MSRSCTILLVFVSLVALSFVRSAHATIPETAATTIATTIATNPHGDNGDCTLCHVAPVEKLRGWFVWPSTKRQLVSDPTLLCQKCHGVSFGHGVGKKPLINRSGLPLGADGTINCALTCHDMHISGVDDDSQLRYHLRLPHEKLCVSCHNK